VVPFVAPKCHQSFRDLDYAVAAIDTTDAKTELERHFLDLEVDGYTIERIIEATTLQAGMLKLPSHIA
jgi:hypothetical protein